ncbi:MAG TPA: laminin G domain-containing protein [Gaiellales bacterium]|nr:laminin G domain-containing protein [Gaiellales bacterium]
MTCDTWVDGRWVASQLPSSGDYDILRKGAATINGQRGTEYKLELLPTGHAYCELRGTIGTVKLTGATNLADGAWHTIVCSRTGIGSMSLQVDQGPILTATASTSIGSIASSLPFFVGGCLNPVLQDFYRGQIDEVTYASG